MVESMVVAVVVVSRDGSLGGSVVAVPAGALKAFEASRDGSFGGTAAALSGGVTLRAGSAGALELSGGGGAGDLSSAPSADGSGRCDDSPMAIGARAGSGGGGSEVDGVSSSGSSSAMSASSTSSSPPPPALEVVEASSLMSVSLVRSSSPPRPSDLPANLSHVARSCTSTTASAARSVCLFLKRKLQTPEKPLLDTSARSSVHLATVLAAERSLTVTVRDSSACDAGLAFMWYTSVTGLSDSGHVTAPLPGVHTASAVSVAFSLLCLEPMSKSSEMREPSSLASRSRARSGTSSS